MEVKKTFHTLKDMAPPPPTPSSSQTTLKDEDRYFSQMSQEELDKATHEIMMQQFAFACTLA